MEKSNEELIVGIKELPKEKSFPDEIFYRIFEIEDGVERAKYIESLRNAAASVHRRGEFNNVYKAFRIE